MSLTGTRHERWRVDLLDDFDRFKRPLTEFLGGGYEINANRAIWGGGSLELVMGAGSDDIDWSKDRFKIWYSPGFEDVRVSDGLLDEGPYTWVPLGGGRVRFESKVPENTDFRWSFSGPWGGSNAGGWEQVETGAAVVEIEFPMPGEYDLEYETAGDAYPTHRLTITPEMFRGRYGTYRRERVWWGRGVFLPSLPEIEHDEETGLMTGSVKIMDKLLVLDQDRSAGAYSAPAGTAVVAEVRRLIEEAGEDNHAVEDSSEVISGSTVWDPDTSKLQVINDLLRAVGYTSLRCDSDGRYRAQKQVPVARRGVAWTFRQGEDSLHIPRWTRSDDWADTPNRVVMTSQGDDETEAMRSVATNENPASKFSYQRRGHRWIDHIESDVQVTSQAVLNDLAQMRLGGLATTYSNLSVEHAMLDLWPEDRVDLATDAADTSAEVRSFSVSMAPGALVGASWREVIDV